MTPNILFELERALRDRRAVALVTNVQSGAQKIIARNEAGSGSDIEKAFRFDQSGMLGDEFVAIHNPPLRLVIIGAVLIAQAMAPLAKACGYDVTVVDPRGAYATDVRFPDVAIKAEWPQEVLPALGLDVRTALIALTHDPKVDDPALELALKSDVFYIGALGSKKTQVSRRERLLKVGFDETALDRINGPIGLPIGAVGAAEIAVSIMAEMTKALRTGLA